MNSDPGVRAAEAPKHTDAVGVTVAEKKAAAAHLSGGQ
jgi:hypothetical protein